MAKKDLKNLHKSKEEAANSEDCDTFVASKEGSKDMSASKEAIKTENLNEEETLKQKCAELEDQYKRLMADFKNMSKRVERERQEIRKYASVNTIESILPAIDNFEFAKKSLSDEISKEDVLRSLDMLKTQFMQILNNEGLEPVKTDGVFNPEFHEAVSKIKDPEKEEGTIIEVLKEGYKINGRVLRAATVVVSTKED